MSAQLNAVSSSAILAAELPLVLVAVWCMQLCWEEKQEGVAAVHEAQGWVLRCFKPCSEQLQQPVTGYICR